MMWLESSVVGVMCFWCNREYSDAIIVIVATAISTAAAAAAAALLILQRPAARLASLTAHKNLTLLHRPNVHAFMHTRLVLSLLFRATPTNGKVIVEALAIIHVQQNHWWWIIVRYTWRCHLRDIPIGLTLNDIQTKPRIEYWHETLFSLLG